jgi:hypothetical protein
VRRCFWSLRPVAQLSRRAACSTRSSGGPPEPRPGWRAYLSWSRCPLAQLSRRAACSTRSSGGPPEPRLLCLPYPVEHTAGLCHAPPVSPLRLHTGADTVVNRNVPTRVAIQLDAGVLTPACLLRLDESKRSGALIRFVSCNQKTPVLFGTHSGSAPCRGYSCSSSDSLGIDPMDAGGIRAKKGFAFCVRSLGTLDVSIR